MSNGGMCGPAHEDDQRDSAIAVTTAQKTAIRRPCLGSIAPPPSDAEPRAHVTSISPSIQPIVCIGPPLP